MMLAGCPEEHRTELEHVQASRICVIIGMRHYLCRQRETHIGIRQGCNSANLSCATQRTRSQKEDSGHASAVIHREGWAGNFAGFPSHACCSNANAQQLMLYTWTSACKRRRIADESWMSVCTLPTKMVQKRFWEVAGNASHKFKT